MKKKLLAMLLMVTVVFGLAACGSAETPSANTSDQEKETAPETPDSAADAEAPGSDTAAAGYDGPEYTLQFGHIGAEGSIEDKFSLRFKELIEEKSNGKIKIDIFGNSQQGSLSDLFDAIRYETLDIAIFAITDADNYYPKADLISLPYIFNSFEHVEAFYNSDVYADMCDEFAAETNCREMSSFHAGFRCILSNKEIHEAKDMEGLVIRVPEIQSYVSTFGALGCNTISLPASEVYQGLSTGLVEATEAAPSFMRSQNYHDQSKYCILSRHIYCGNSMYMSQSKLDGMDAAAVELLKEASQEAAQYAREIAEEEDASALQAFEDAGVQLIEPDRESFQAAMSDVWNELVLDKLDNGQELIQKIQACDPN